MCIKVSHLWGASNGVGYGSACETPNAQDLVLEERTALNMHWTRSAGGAAKVKIPELLTRAAETDPDLAGDAPMAARDLNLRLGKEAVAPDLAQALIAHAGQFAGDARLKCFEVFAFRHGRNCAACDTDVQRQVEAPEPSCNAHRERSKCVEC